MNFSEQLNNYMNILECSAKELSEKSKISQALISRYRNGQKVPKFDSEQFNNLINGIYDISVEKEKNELSKEEIYNSFVQALPVEDAGINYDIFINNFNEIITALSINASDLARNIGIDASSISRFRSGARKPSDINSFIDKVVNYIMQSCTSDDKKEIIINILNISNADFENADIYREKLYTWFCNNTEKPQNHIEIFLTKIDEFNLEEYIDLIHFDDIKVPANHFNIPINKHYFGIDGMKQGELDFFKSAIPSKASESIFMCSDMPMNEMAEDEDFGQKWMYNISVALKKGMFLNVIHDVNRPFSHVMYGLESWIPIYMTGQVSTYYIPEITDSIYNHLTYVSERLALTGDSINGFYNDAKYSLTNNKDLVAYYKQKSENLIKKSKPFMDIYRAEHVESFKIFVHNNVKDKCNRFNIIHSLPIYTISKGNLLDILYSNDISEEDINKILEFVEHEKSNFKKILASNKITDTIHGMTEEEFNQNGATLSLGGMFYDKKITYTYKEYLEHLENTRKKMNKYENYNLVETADNKFKNINIQIQKDDCIVISKDTNPAIHFVVYYDKLRNSIENYFKF